MPDHIRYDLLTQQALRGVVRKVLGDAARKNALPGEHHFYISFDTTAGGVRLSDRLRGQYPEQMTIILQHQFWDLEVDDLGFEVGLSFGGVPEKLYVPFDSIKGFFDPSVQFGLQFEEVGESEAQPAADAAKPASKKKLPPAAAPAPPLSPAAADAKPARTADKTADKAADKSSDKPAESPGDPDKPSGGAEVVRLDRFRKK